MLTNLQKCFPSTSSAIAKNERNYEMKLIDQWITLALLLLFSGISTAHLLGNPATEARIAEVIAYAKDNPVAEAPISTHPKKPEKTFSRLFNISLSSRAYFQLHTDPSLDASSGRMLEKVAQYYLDHPEEIGDPDSSYWAGEYHSAALVKFGISGTERKGAIPRESEWVVLEYMLSYVNYWSRPAHYDFSLEHQTYVYWNSENHWWQEIVTTWAYLLALKKDPDFADRKLKDGKSIEEHFQINSAYMRQHMQHRARKGFLVEISSGGYSTRMHNMWYTIYDLSPDEDLRDLAQKTLDLWWAFWAEEQVSGERGGGKVRHRNLRGLTPNSEGHMLPAWFYFAIGSLDMEHIRGIKPDSIALASHYIALLSGYRPDEVVYGILEDRKHAPAYAITQRRLGRSALDRVEVPEAFAVNAQCYDFTKGNCLKYSWVTPNFVLGTVMRPPSPVSEWEKGSAQSWWHGLLVSGNEPGDSPERVVPAVLHKGDSLGEQYAVQSKGSFMARKLPDAASKTMDNRKFPMGIYISNGLMEYTDAQGECIFINSPRCWVVIRAVGTRFIKSDNKLAPGHQTLGSFFGMEDDLRPVIIEAADPGSRPNFQTFREAVEAAALNSTNGKHTYRSLSGDELAMQDDRSNPTINGREIEYNPPMAYSSRYVKSEWDSGIVKISAGGTEKILDFTAE